MADREASPIPLEIRARLAELELELSEGDITQKGYEKKRSKLIRAFYPHAGGMEGPMSHRAPLGPPSAARFHRRRTSGTRDERYRSDVHTEAVQAVLARHVERKVAVPMPSKRRSLVVQTSMDAYTPPGLSPLCSDSSSGSDEEAGPGDDMSAMEHWMSRPSHLGPAHLGSTSSSSSSTQSGGSGNAGRLADSLAHAHITHSHLVHTHLAHLGHQQSHLSQSHHGKIPFSRL
ncbi:hypothetical protein LDENG_00201790 [Lucifuga dentata]|nr:hypothetical protein LDENG_00201790 [Lucifuga dentata]